MNISSITCSRSRGAFEWLERNVWAAFRAPAAQAHEGARVAHEHDLFGGFWKVVVAELRSPPSRVPHPSFLITAPPASPRFFVAAGVATPRPCVALSKFDYDDDGDDVLRCVLAPSFTANSCAC